MSLPAASTGCRLDRPLALTLAALHSYSVKPSHIIHSVGCQLSATMPVTGCMGAGGRLPPVGSTAQPGCIALQRSGSHMAVETARFEQTLCTYGLSDMHATCDMFKQAQQMCMQPMPSHQPRNRYVSTALATDYRQSAFRVSIAPLHLICSHPVMP
jgi:hypothetical protein